MIGYTSGTARGKAAFVLGGALLATLAVAAIASADARGGAAATTGDQDRDRTQLQDPVMDQDHLWTRDHLDAVFMTTDLVPSPDQDRERDETCGEDGSCVPDQDRNRIRAGTASQAAEPATDHQDGAGQGWQQARERAQVQDQTQTQAQQQEQEQTQEQTRAGPDTSGTPGPDGQPGGHGGS